MRRARWGKLALMAAVLPVLAPSPVAPRPPAPVPPPPADVADVTYGPYERNVLDFWRAKSDRPTPLIIYIHGGGFRQGHKGQVPASLVVGALKSGISVASLDYRLSNIAPFPAPMLDGARAIQFLRSRAKEWNLDPARFAAAGSSAGGGISLWVAFHDDLARPGSADPVERQSSRLACVGGFAAQPSYDPRFVRRHVGGNEISHSALPAFYGLSREQFDTPQAHALFEAAAAINYLTADDPPAFLFYGEAPPAPLPADASENDVIHHQQLGFVLEEKMRALGIRCEVRVLSGGGLERRDKVHLEMLDRLRECLRAR